MQCYRIVSCNVETIFLQARSGALNEEYDHNTLLHNSATHHAGFDNLAPSDSPSNVSYPVQNYGEIDIMVEKVVERVLTSLGHHVAKREPMTITELFERYMADPAANRSPKSIIEYNSVFGVLTDLVGADTSIYDVDRQTCRDVMEVLRHIPPHATKKFPGKTWPDISSIARERS